MEKEILIWGHDNSFVSFDDDVDGVEDEGIEVPWDEILEEDEDNEWGPCNCVICSIENASRKFF